MFPILMIWSDWGLLALRIALGILLAVHGIPKLRNLRGTAEWFAAQGFKPGKFWGTIAAFLEFFGGIALIVGLFSQAVAGLLVLEFLVILLWRLKNRESFVGGYELDLLVFASALALLTLGGGGYSVESFLWYF